MGKEKSILVTYLLWLFAGFFGVHHFYLGRDRHAFLWWMSIGGYFGIGWISDFFLIPRYVKDANEDPKYMEGLIEKMRVYSVPPNSTVRYFFQIAVADALGYLSMAALPEEFIPESFMPWAKCITPFSVALGVHLVGNIGRQQGSFLYALAGAFAVYPLYIFGYPSVFLTSCASCYLFNNYAVQWRRTPREKKSVLKRFSILLFCATLYLSLWASFFYFNCAIVPEEGEEVKCRDAAKHFFNSPMWKEFLSVGKKLWEVAREKGWREFWRCIVEAFDPEGKANALRVLELDENATEQQITSQYRKLSRKWHPDKHHDEEAKLIAQEKFIEIAQAYEILIKAHRKSKRTNRTQ